MDFKEYICFNDIHKNDEVKITSTDSSWNGLYGIIQDIDYTSKLATVFCSAHPHLVYFIHEDNIDDITFID